MGGHSRQKLLAGSSLVVMGVILGMAAVEPAQALTIAGTQIGTGTVNSSTTPYVVTGVVQGSTNGVFVASGSNLVLTNSGLITGGDGVYDTGTNTTITNTGTITSTIQDTHGNYGGVISAGIMAQLNNNSGGVIKGMTGVFVASSSTIHTLSNSGVISGSRAGINNTGRIDTLINTGTIADVFGTTIISGSIVTISSRPMAIHDTGGIGTLSNSGLITSVFTGMYLEGGSIGTLVNSGSINGAYFGVVVYDVINSLSNTGTGSIGAGQTAFAIANGGTINTLSNSGTIRAGSRAIWLTGSTAGAAGTIGTLDNAGLLMGGGAAILVDTLSSLGVINNSGTIVGNITLNGGDSVVINGGTGATVGTLTGYSTISTVLNIGALSANSNLTLASGNLLLNDNVTAPTLVNTANLSLVNTLTVTGSYRQTTGALTLGSSGNLEHYDFRLVHTRNF
ncbi:MAG: hypothetical protein PW843_07955 [Azospirillaceae bacterium]|nr:hypothetical protein [Azospirillaceae bacterium]